MARLLTYNINRFDGGMTSSPRDVTQRDRFAYLSHFDIYRDTGKMYVMPGYVNDNAYDSSATGLKQFRIRAFWSNSQSGIYGLGTKSDGTGTKLMQRDFADSEWKVPVVTGWDTEGVNTLPKRPAFFYDNTGEWFFVQQVTTSTHLARISSGGINETFGTITTGVGVINTGGYTVERGFDGKFYITKNGGAGGVSSLTGTTFAQTAKSTLGGSYDVQSGSYQVAIGFAILGKSRVMLWDSASLLADQIIPLGDGIVRVLGYPSNTWTTVVQQGNTNTLANGQAQMAVKYLNGEQVETRYEITTESTVQMDIYSLRGGYRSTMSWYAMVPTNSDGSEFISGIWAFGKGQDNAQMGVSVLLDTSSLGDFTNAYWYGNSLYIAHGSDWSVSRLDNFDTGTFDVKAKAETVWYGQETPFQKSLKGISVVTNPLPSGAQVEMFYRVNDGDVWTSLGVSDTVGKMRHSFTRVNGSPIGQFQEIQFKFEVLGKMSVQNIAIVLEETNNLPY